MTRRRSLLFAPLANAIPMLVAARTSVTVQGVLCVGEFYGPPNYGEQPTSDRIEHSYYIQLPASLQVQLAKQPGAAAAAGDSGESVFIQLVILSPTESAKARTLTGKRVSVLGSLMHAETGHHRTPVLLQVSDLAQVKSWHW